jgi:hypothetical protein
MYSRTLTVVAVTAGIAAAMVGAALPAAAASPPIASRYTVTSPANVHLSPTHSSEVLEVKHTGDGVTSPLPKCEGVLDLDGTTLWIQVNLANGNEGWMGSGQLDDGVCG